MSATVARLLPSRGKCTQSQKCGCDVGLFGPFYKEKAEKATEACHCKHPWWMHVVARTEHGGCISTGCGGYYSNVLSLCTFRTIRHSLSPRRIKELTLRHVYVASHMTVTSSLSRLHPRQTLGRIPPASPIARLHVHMLTFAMLMYRAGSHFP